MIQRSTILNVVQLLIVCSLMNGRLAAANESSVVTFQPSQCQNFTCTDDGKSLAANINPGQKLGAAATLPVCDEAGWYVLTAEYKTTGMNPMGVFILDIAGVKILPWQPFAAATKWSPLRLYFQTSQAAESCTLRLGGEAGQLRMEQSGKVQLRNVKVQTYEMPNDQELLGNADLAWGQVGELASQWTWAYHGRSDDYALVADKSFQAGTQTLRIISENKEQGRTIQSSKLPMPEPGHLTFSVWGRSDDAQMSMIFYLISSDYKWLKAKTFPLTSNWVKHTFEVPVPENPSAIYFSPRIDIKGNGAAHIAGTSLKWVRKKAVIQMPKAQSREGGRNLLSNPGMEMGFKGWTFDYFMPGQSPQLAVSQIKTDECKILPKVGVDGSRALLLTPRNCLVSECVPVSQGKTYTVSGYFKAKKPGASAVLFFIDPGWQIYQKGINNIPTDRWQRFSMTITWDKPTVQKKAYVRIDPGSTEILIDCVQVEEGALTAYQSPSIMLDLQGEKQVYDKNSSVDGMYARLLVNNNAAMPSQVQLQVKDAWGKLIQTQSLDLKANHDKPIQLIQLPSDRLGVFRVILRAQDASGKLLAESESRYAILDAPSPAMLPTGFPLFGICHEAMMPMWMDKHTVPMFARMGPGMNRFFLSNDLLLDANYREVLKSQLDFQYDNGFKTIIANVEFPHALRKKFETNDQVTSEALEEWSLYLQKVVPPLKKQIRYWEILNEANIWRFSDGPQKGERSMKPQKYVQVLRTAYETIKSIDPQLQVVGFSLATADYDYVRACLKLGAARYMDVFTWHAYREAADMPDVYTDLLKMKAMLKSFGFTGQTINGEQYFSANLYMFHNHNAEVGRRYTVGADEEMLATGRIMQNYIHHAAAQVPWAIFTPGANLLKYGGQDRTYMYLAYGAYNAATRMLNNVGKGRPIDMGGDCRAFIFPDAQGGPLLAMYTLLSEFNGHMKIGTQQFDAYDMMGNLISPDVIKRDGLPMQISPVYVRLPQGTTVLQVEKMLGEATITGMGDPFGVRLTMMPGGQLGVVVTNRMNQSVDGKVMLRDYPRDWIFDHQNHTFNTMAANASTVVSFAGQLPYVAMGEYPITVTVLGQEKFTRKELRISPIFASHTQNPTIGGSISQWTSWIDLGEDRLSPDFAPSDPHTGAKDLSARLALGWDKEGLSMVVVVNDDVAKFSQGRSDYNNDSLQIYFDQKKNAPTLEALCDSDDVTYLVCKNGDKALAIVEKGIEGRYLGASNQSVGIDPDVQTSIMRQGNQTIYQMRFPAKCLPMVSFEAGTALGFSILINDNDSKGRKTGLTLAPKGDEPYNKPYNYRTLIFQ